MILVWTRPNHITAPDFHLGLWSGKSAQLAQFQLFLRRWKSYVFFRPTFAWFKQHDSVGRMVEVRFGKEIEKVVGWHMSLPCWQCNTSGSPCTAWCFKPPPSFLDLIGIWYWWMHYFLSSQDNNNDVRKHQKRETKPEKRRKTCHAPRCSRHLASRAVHQCKKLIFSWAIQRIVKVGGWDHNIVLSNRPASQLIQFFPLSLSLSDSSFPPSRAFIIFLSLIYLHPRLLGNH